MQTTAGIFKNAITDLGHEFSHVYDDAKKIPNLFNSYYQGLSKSEWRASYKENLIRQELKMPLRTTYSFSIQKSGGNRQQIQVSLLKKGAPYMPMEIMFTNYPVK